MPSHSLGRIGIVEDDPVMGGSLVQRLTLEGYEAQWWSTGSEALDALNRARPDLLVCDIRLPDMTGEDIFEQVLPWLGGMPVLFMTAFGDIDQAVRLMRAGASDYLTKPFEMGDFLERVQVLLRDHNAAAALRAAPLGISVPMRQVEAMLRRVADIDSTLMITGESGVGKEVAARFVHQVSHRAPRPFVAVNCAAIPADLIESELFGHERGAFTGAATQHRGYAERAADGILFLDEIAELQPATQAKLLRLIQERVFHRVGGERPVPFRARLICATNADLQARVRDGRFRSDLFYRINVIPVTLPPLRERPEDVRALLAFFIRQFATMFGRDIRGLSPAAQAAALAHSWPGNVRELRNRVERAVALSHSPWLGPAALFPELETAAPAAPDGPAIAPLAEVRDEAERAHIRAALRETGGQIQKTARLLGISRTTLWDKMRRLGLVHEEEDAEAPRSQT